MECRWARDGRIGTARWGGGTSGGWLGLACGVGLVGGGGLGGVCAFGKGGEGGGGKKVVAGLGGVHDYVFVRERVWRGLLFSREGHWSGVRIKVIRSI